MTVLATDAKETVDTLEVVVTVADVDNEGMASRYDLSGEPGSSRPIGASSVPGANAKQ